MKLQIEKIKKSIIFANKYRNAVAKHKKTTTWELKDYFFCFYSSAPWL